MHLGGQSRNSQVRFLSWIRWKVRAVARWRRGIAGVNQLCQENLIRLGLLTAGLFELELAQSVFAQDTHGFALAPRLQISRSELVGTLLLQLLPALAVSDSLSGLAQHGLDKLHLGGGKALLGGAYSGGLFAPLDSFGKAALEGAKLRHGFIEALARLFFKQAADTKNSFELKAESHYSAMVNRAAMVRSSCGVSSGA